MIATPTAAMRANTRVVMPLSVDESFDVLVTVLHEGLEGVAS
jgi:hypothetical protein